MNSNSMDAMNSADAMTATATAVAAAPRPAALDAIPSEKLVEIDVREELRNGQEPFRRIMAARQRVPEGGALSLRAIFEPVPLYNVLAKQGFAHYTEQLGDADWQVWFYPSNQPAAPTAPPATNTSALSDDIEAGVIVLDVRYMEPPEPMVLTLEALETLPPDRTLLQINARVPKFLLPMLEERGFSYEIREQAPDLVRVFIRHQVANGVVPSHQLPDTPMATTRMLDVRTLPPQVKHLTIFNTFAALSPGASFVLINDHDPKPLRYQFEYEHTGKFGWQYLEEGPLVWRVEISRTAA